MRYAYEVRIWAKRCDRYQYVGVHKTFSLVGALWKAFRLFVFDGEDVVKIEKV